MDLLEIERFFGNMNKVLNSATTVAFNCCNIVNATQANQTKHATHAAFSQKQYNGIQKNNILRQLYLLERYEGDNNL